MLRPAPRALVVDLPMMRRTQSGCNTGVVGVHSLWVVEVGGNGGDGVLDLYDSAVGFVSGSTVDGSA